MNKLMDGLRKRYKITILKRVKKKLIPPKDGLDWLLQRIVTSFLLRIPKVVEKLISKELKKIEKTIPLVQKIK